jgi:hypothetical protein
MTRSDPVGEAAMLICNFSEQSQLVSVSSAGRHWERPLWTADPAYGGKPEMARPPNFIVAETIAGKVPLDGFAAALYLSGS